MNQSIIGSTDIFPDTRIRPNWRHVGAFLGLTFGLTWLLDLIVYLRGGLATAGVTTILQLQMLLPAFSAIVLGLFFFRESPIYRGRPAGRGRWFYYYFLALTVICALAALGVWLAPDQPALKLATSMVPLVLSFLGLLLLVVLRAVAGREAMARVGLAGGNWRYWLVFGLAIVAWYVLQAALNAITGLGGSQLTPLPPVPGLDPTAMLIVAAVQTVLLGPILGLVITFGEEYGWRGYLQSELFKLGRVRGVLLLGVIWGAWHWPLILMGYNYPGHPLLGLALTVLYMMGLGIVLATPYSSRAASCWPPSCTRSTTGRGFHYRGRLCPARHRHLLSHRHLRIATLAVAAFLILRDPIWRRQGSNPA